jgi:catechol 2,3-dioxygenase-like lactoylglutathione lyase family enzyme
MVVENETSTPSAAALAEPFAAACGSPASQLGPRVLITGIDHFVLTVRSLEETCAFYERVLGLRRIDTGGLPTALAFGGHRINVHEAGHTFEPKAKVATPGAGDFCLITDRPIATMQAHLEACGIAVEVGPVKRSGAMGPMTSVYFRDPDGNLVEVSEYQT